MCRRPFRGRAISRFGPLGIRRPTMLASAIRDLKALEPRRYEGRVTALEGLRIEAAGPATALRLGASVRFGTEDGPRGELVGFEGERAIMLACDELQGL